jgi:hypothetical protein
MMAKAVRLQKNKDNSGNPPPSADFVLLSSLPDDHLLSVASDSGLALVSGAGSVDEFLSLVRAKELPRLPWRRLKLSLMSKRLRRQLRR